MTPARQLPWGRRRDVRVEVGGIERQHIRRKLEPPHRRPREGHLRRLQLLLGHLLRQPVKRLPAERLIRQAREPRDAAAKKVSQVALRPGPACALDRHGQHHLPHRRPLLGPKAAAGAIDVLDEVQLLGDPHQRADVPHRAGADGLRRLQVRHPRRIRRPQDGLPRHGPPGLGIPNGLGSHAIAAAANLTLEKMHIAHVARAI
jgi:hypothetical protein